LVQINRRRGVRYKLSFDKPAFAEYEPSLRSLENSFRKAGVSITFEAGLLPENGGRIIFINNGRRIVKSIMIEGDSPAQAVKDVAAAVRL
jgi:hypothetical protein